MNGVKEAFLQTMTNQKLWGAIIATIVTILLSYGLTKANILKKEWKAGLVKVVMTIAVPALVLTGFMKTANIKQLQEQGVILGISFAFYIVLNLIAFLWSKYAPNLAKKSAEMIQDNKALNSDGSMSQNRALIMWMMIIFGSTTFFGFPIIQAIYPKSGFIAANIWNIAYRVFLYSFCFMLISGVKWSKANFKDAMKKTFVNPIVICTFLGLILWLTTLIPNQSYGLNFKHVKDGVAWFEFDKTLPLVHTTFSKLGALAAPITWIAIGITLASSNFKKAVKDKWVWIFSIQKLVILPLFVFLIFLGLNQAGLVSKEVGVSMVILAATPPATVVILYAIQYKMHEEFAAQCSTLTTLLAVIMLPLWVVISSIAFI
ncbi:malate permease [Mycoplasma feriruminatoris]|uniref:AEC family transporter n=1 Tax=Mycoplasma feriruminatoris TaxID=1179777 RepID=UPI00241CEB40|nr:AEC family transporter [Mycoplasma feriruminatoris]WFQ95632.1 malate permease [Mycoplasma feriruminatoris]